MFDVWQIAAHALWIIGLAVLLAVWSFGYYEGQQSGEPVLPLLVKPNYDLALTLGFALFFAGLLGADGRIAAKIIWGVLVVVTVTVFIFHRRSMRL